MAKIIRTDEQAAALREVTASIRIVDRINAAVNVDAQERDEASVAVSIGSTRASLPVAYGSVRTFLESERRIRVARVRALAKKYAIGLDEADEAVLSGGKHSDAVAAPDDEHVNFADTVAESGQE